METRSREPEAHRKADSEDSPREPTSSADLGALELIRHALALHPEERLAVLQDFVDTFWTPRHG